jgi:formylaminopyrimidine deformylase / aminopyrimidine aminohydrolase
MKNSSKLLKKAKNEWKRMISHPFLMEVGNGTIEREIFHFWVTQDYVFVREAIRFLGALELRSPDDEISLGLAEAFVALKNELKMFEKYKKGLSLNVEPTIVCRSYIDFLISTALTKSFEESFAALWCAEKGYFDSWNGAKKLAKKNNPYKTFIDNWTSDEFKKYVNWIEKTLNRLLKGIPGWKLRSVEKAFLITAKYECQFWDMAYSGNTERSNLLR